MSNPVNLLALVEALATASATSLPVLALKQSRFLGPCRINIERASTTGGGTVWGAYLPGSASDPSKYQEARGDGTATTFATLIPHAALSNYNTMVRASKSGRTGTVAVSAAGITVTGTSTAFLTELRIGDEIQIGSEIRNVIAIASATSLTVDAPFLNAASGATLFLIDGILAATTDYTISNVGGFVQVNVGAAAKAPAGCKLEIMAITPVALYTFATATVQFKELELNRGADVFWYASDATATPGATNVYVEPIGV